MRTAHVIAILLLLVIAAGLSGAALERREAAGGEESPLLYLPNGRYLRVASLGQSSVLADAIYIWAIQYYSNYERADRFRYVEHIFGNVIVELDPQFHDPYWLGAMILAVEARDLDAAVRLLDKGLANNPEQWIFPYLAGWECYEAGDPARAAEYFLKAAEVPGAPMLPRRMHAGMIARAGDRSTALELWLEVLEDPQSDAATRRIAERQARALREEIDIERITDAIDRFRLETGGLPRSLDALHERGYLAEVPLDPNGTPYAYDPNTGRISATSGRILGAES